MEITLNTYIVTYLFLNRRSPLVTSLVHLSILIFASFLYVSVGILKVRRTDWVNGRLIYWYREPGEGGVIFLLAPSRNSIIIHQLKSFNHLSKYLSSFYSSTFNPMFYVTFFRATVLLKIDFKCLNHSFHLTYFATSPVLKLGRECTRDGALLLFVLCFAHPYFFIILERGEQWIYLNR